MREVTGLHEARSVQPIRLLWAQGCSSSIAPGSQCPTPLPVLPLTYILSTPHLHFFLPTKIQFSLSRCHLRSYSEIILDFHNDNRSSSYSRLEAPVIPGANASSGQMPCPSWHKPSLPRQARVQGQPASAKLPPPPSGPFLWWETPGNVSQAFCLCQKDHWLQLGYEDDLGSYRANSYWARAGS